MIDKISDSCFSPSRLALNTLQEATDLAPTSIVEVEVFEGESGLFFIAWEPARYPFYRGFMKKGQWCEGRYLPSSEPIHFQPDRSPARSGLYLHRCEQVGKLLAQI